MEGLLVTEGEFSRADIKVKKNLSFEVRVLFDRRIYLTQDHGFGLDF